MGYPFIHHLTDMVTHSTVLFAPVLKDGQISKYILFCVEGICVSVNVCMCVCGIRMCMTVCLCI